MYFVQYLRSKHGKVESRHLWLLYLSSQCFGSNWGKILSHTDANGFSLLKMKLFANKKGWRKLGFIWYTSKTSLIPIKLWHSALTTAAYCMRIWLILRISQKFLTSLPVSDHLSSYYFIRHHLFVFLFFFFGMSTIIFIFKC